MKKLRIENNLKEGDLTAIDVLRLLIKTKEYKDKFGKDYKYIKERDEAWKLAYYIVNKELKK